MAEKVELEAGCHEVLEKFLTLRNNLAKYGDANFSVSIKNGKIVARFELHEVSNLQTTTRTSKRNRRKKNKTAQVYSKNMQTNILEPSEVCVNKIVRIETKNVSTQTDSESYEINHTGRRGGEGIPLQVLPTPPQKMVCLPPLGGMSIGDGRIYPNLIPKLQETSRPIDKIRAELAEYQYSQARRERELRRAYKEKEYIDLEDPPFILNRVWDKKLGKTVLKQVNKANQRQTDHQRTGIRKFDRRNMEM